MALWGDDGVRWLAAAFGGHAEAAAWHRWLGYAVPLAPLLAVLWRPRAVGRFARECTRLERGDLSWWVRFPGFVLAPRRWSLPRHGGHFDPGQRLMAWALVLVLAVLTITGLLMIFAIEWLGARYGVVLRTHTRASVLLLVLVVGHTAVSAGLPRGYRGVWRAMHFPARGQVPAAVAARLWPAWFERHRCDDGPGTPRGDSR